MKIDGSLARNTPFEEADFGVHSKTHRKTLIYFVATKEDREVLYEMLVLRLLHVDVFSRVFGFVLAFAYGGRSKTSHF